MKNSTAIFEIALGLTSPWTVKNIYFEQHDLARELHIHLDFEKGFKFKQKDESESVAHDTVERKWQHLNFFEHKCYIHAGVPLVLDKSGKVQLQPVPWAKKGSGFKLLFELVSLLLIESEILVAKAVKLVNGYPNLALSLMASPILMLGQNVSKIGNSALCVIHAKHEAKRRRLFLKTQLQLPQSKFQVGTENASCQ